MFAIERQRMIKQLLNQNKHVSVAELSCCLNVSEVTIRRDLEKLEGERFLMRTHGGAVLHGALPKSRIPVLDILNIMHTFIQNRSCLKKMFSCAGSQSATCRIICIFSHMLAPPEKYPAFFPPSPTKREEHDVQDVQYPNIRHIQYNYL